MTKETWLVTGGAGFIGSNFVRWALERRPKVRIVVLDKLTYAGSLENLRDLPSPERFEFIRGDIARIEDVRQVFEAHRPDRILNFAAESHVDRSIDGPRAFIDTNIGGTFELLEAARCHFATLSETDKAKFRFLHVSTDEVYGSLGAEGYFTEETAYAPNSPYSASKASADLLVRAYHHTYQLPTITTNCSNNYGPLQFPEKLIPLMVLNALEGKPLPIYGDGGNIRDWIYVEDHCAGIVAALDGGRPGEQYAFGGGCELSNLDVVDGICDALEDLRPATDNDALKRQGLVDYRELKSFVDDRPGHDRRYAIDASKAKQELDWAPQFEFKTAVAETIAWYLDHEDWRAAIQARSDSRSRQGLTTAEAAASNRSAQSPGKE
ncbi:MAG: dTDP-glucose 4,6-dehydratase [Myxococcales bacterium]|nr:dTDP-glucose 4,6-dehydratase [Myxococcales bacterium]HIL81119.1 dTDP-glucose 4,6-dehydratase [Myxococcales bacterium]